MTRFTLNPTPTFTAKVGIHVPGAGTEQVEFTFRHRDRDQYQAFVQELKGKDDADIVMECACGWELADRFDRDNVEKLVRNYIGSAGSVLKTYAGELALAREGN
ncbi:phage tail assembly chaperone [Laribacter hongkongensis]|uniref:TfmS n=1 Tax=Laribacter hongkongensis (strain HLHK9) TaxID=557598 RepID=C1D8F9_LARHH|nr:phage tail assembly chaperone [Laribacter hongkongensis]ACO74749.1 TfmS [Laribacter hongkongensis HLHK9]MCG8990879.1 phage tail assembly chaperone [Laribacter hongkongensis]MCG8997053.1 phage tail assembly chaperone [Laribacter hongkongensis]MCG9001875.1 phage tail assembly chaperone [Laribacter hongkongensis]MCG9003544.1 phage tail assembly chaperone [Laribacter hongkongensis]